VLASPSLNHEMRDLQRAIVCCREERAKECSLSLFRNHNSKLERTRWSCVISNWCRTSVARLHWLLMCPTFFWLQLWRALMVALNFFARVLKGQDVEWTEDHANSTVSWKPSRVGQKDSKWNRALAGCTSFRPNRSGQWSEPSLAMLCKRQFGKSCSHSVEQKTLSSLTSVAESCWLDQVNFLPCNDNSFNSKSFISRWNLPIIALLRFPLFLSSSLVMRLKSPSTVQGPWHADLTFLNSCRKRTLLSSPWGPYTQVSHQGSRVVGENCKETL